MEDAIRDEEMMFGCAFAALPGGGGGGEGEKWLPYLDHCLFEMRKGCLGGSSMDSSCASKRGLTAGQGGGGGWSSG